MVMKMSWAPLDQVERFLCRCSGHRGHAILALAEHESDISSGRADSIFNGLSRTAVSPSIGQRQPLDARGVS
jgi:hypothetical protein